MVSICYAIALYIFRKTQDDDSVTAGLGMLFLLTVIGDLFITAEVILPRILP